jgi:hypothetical protein
MQRITQQQYEQLNALLTEDGMMEQVLSVLDLKMPVPRVKARIVELSEREWLAISRAASVLERFVDNFEVYGGVEPKKEMGYIRAAEGQWYNAKDTECEVPGDDHQWQPDES